jgi:hypothetical protein
VRTEDEFDESGLRQCAEECQCWGGLRSGGFVKFQLVPRGVRMVDSIIMAALVLQSFHSRVSGCNHGDPPPLDWAIEHVWLHDA